MSCREASKRRLQPGSGCCKQRPRQQLKARRNQTYCPTPSWAAPAPRGRPWAPGVGRLPAARAGHARVSTSIRQEHRRPRTAAELEPWLAWCRLSSLCGQALAVGATASGPPPQSPQCQLAPTRSARAAHMQRRKERARVGRPPRPAPDHGSSGALPNQLACTVAFLAASLSGMFGARRPPVWRCASARWAM